jgi:hypothetical protein
MEMKKLTPEEKKSIEANAVEAARDGLHPKDACPWPFGSEEGKHWIAVWALVWGHSK